MPRARTGGWMKRKVNGKTVYYGRATYYDADGTRRSVARRAMNKTDAQIVGARLAREYANGAPAPATRGACETFGELTAHYEKHYLIPALYIDGHKIRGMSAPQKSRPHLKRLKEHFEARTPLADIGYSDIDAYRAHRFTTTTIRGNPPARATVNAELAMLHRMLNIAIREGWLARDPFKMGEPLIMRSGERHRDRILGRDEEEKLLAQFDMPRREHYRPLVVALIATGMRLGEAKKLKWRDVDLEARRINILGMNTKTHKPRTVGISNRLVGELRWLQGHRKADTSPDALVFTIKDPHHVWAKAREEAGLGKITLHDLRHTRATRWIRAGLSLQHVGRLLGHTKTETTYRYVSATYEDVALSVRLIDEEEERWEGRVN